MKIALHDSDNTGFPNLALMKLSKFHKNEGDHVEWFNSLFTYDTIYSSKVFTFTPQDPYISHGALKGGTGYKNNITLDSVDSSIEHIMPDYDLYGINYSMGFLTRGCIRKCKWCFVPEKEGKIKPHADITEFTKHKDVVLMDNNVLAHDHGIHQIEKIIKLGLRVDFNQGLDARLIDDAIAKLLSKVKWLHPVRLACDSLSMVEPVKKAVKLLRWRNVTPRTYFVYVLIDDIDDAVERLKELKGINVDPFAQPYRDKDGNEPTQKQKDLARWVNHKATFNSVWLEDYK